MLAIVTQQLRIYPTFLRPLAAIVAGILLALSVPPFGLWPLGIVAVALWYALMEGRRPLRRFQIGFVVGITAMGIGISWFSEFSGPGYLLSIIGEAMFFGVAGLLTTRRRLRWAVFAGAVVLAEWLRSSIPFGGIPLAGIDLGQAIGPLAPAARIGGRLMVVGVTALIGAAVAESLLPLFRIAAGTLTGEGRDALDRDARGRRPSRADDPIVRYLTSIGAVFLGIGVVLAGSITSAGTQVGEVDTAVVQGGGPRGFRASEANAVATFRRHLEASDSVTPPVELVVWPEDVVDVARTVADTPEGDALAALAIELGATLTAGVVEDEGTDRFHNAVVAWGPDGEVVGRYEKNRRVPYGEYFPFRSVVEDLADIPERDAIAGKEPGFIDTPAGPLGFAISYEVFFPDRGREAVRAGGQVLIVPTNAASFRGSIVPQQQLAAARLRAWETGRYVVQAGPTGYSAVIDPDGNVLQRSDLSEQVILRASVPLLDGQTPYVRFGDWPLLAVSGAVVGGAWVLAHRDRRWLRAEYADDATAPDRDDAAGTATHGEDDGWEWEWVEVDDDEENESV